MNQQPVEQPAATLADLEAAGVVETFTRYEAQQMGAFDESAIDLPDALDAVRHDEDRDHA